VLRATWDGTGSGCADGGNHDWNGGNGRPYFAYFGPSAGPSAGVLRHDARRVACPLAQQRDPARAGSPQYEWLKAELQRAGSLHGRDVARAAVHVRAQRTGGRHARHLSLLHQHGTELVLSGHNHMYDGSHRRTRRAGGPERPGSSWLARAGYTLYGRARAQANSEVLDTDTWGVLKLTLKSNSYSWESSRSRAGASGCRVGILLAAPGRLSTHCGISGCRLTSHVDRHACVQHSGRTTRRALRPRLRTRRPERHKVATAVELRFNVPASRARRGEGAARGPGRQADERRRRDPDRQPEHRTQAANREAARVRMAALVARAFRRPRPRKATRPTKASRERRSTPRGSAPA